jgi:hypothetical protein
MRSHKRRQISPTAALDLLITTYDKNTSPHTKPRPVPRSGQHVSAWQKFPAPVGGSLSSQLLKR